jgi:hypothetical protein
MEKYSITVYSDAVACLANNMLRGYHGKELHAGVNYTSDSQVYECAKRLEGQNVGVVTDTMGKDFDIRKEFSKFRFVDGFSVFLEEESEYYTLTLYYQNTELVNITFDDGLKNSDKKYMVYINQPNCENGEHGFVERKEKSDKQHVFLETNSAKVAFNMVNRIVANMRYPKAKYVW